MNTNQDWKPIESAPKDGTPVLLFARHINAEASTRVVGAYLHEYGWLSQSYSGQGLAQLVPSHWMELPPYPGAAPEAPPLTVVLDPDPRGVSVGVYQGSRCLYNGAHPIPTGATGDRDWELCCDNCAGTGYILIDRQVAERKTDVQEFKEECEICEGRGFNIAFEDIPGISEYVKSFRPAAMVATGADGRSATYGMTLDERIAHVGGRTNAQSYTEFGSPMAVNALIQHVLRDLDWTRQDDDGAYQARYRLPGGEWSSWGHVVCGVKGHEQELRYLPGERRPAPAAGDALGETVTILPDGSAFAVASFPLPADHWLYAEREYETGAEEPKELPAPILTHEQREAVVAAIRYAVRGATMCGKELDFDPDALVQNAVYALCGPYTAAIAQQKGEA